MKGYINKFVPVLAAAVLFAACEEKPVYNPCVPATHVFLMYDNIGEPYFTNNVNAAGKAVAAGALGAGERVVVFHRQSSGHVIYELVKDRSNVGFSRKELKKYAAGEVVSLSKETVATIVGDVRSLVRAGHYGLAFGSHGRGWIQKSYTGSFSRSGGSPEAELWTISENPLTRYLAYNNREKIDNLEFVDALDEWEWDFILLDDCFMASVEALYEMRRLTDYFIVSPTEILMEGFPYDRVVKTLFNDWTDYAGIAKGFVDYYRDGYADGGRYATVSVVKSSELEALALAVRNIRLGGYNDVDPAAAPAVQYYEGLLKGHVFFDLDDYAGRWAQNDALYAAFDAQMKKTVVFSDHTDSFYSAFGFGTSHAISHYSGLATFIMPNSVWVGSANAIALAPWYRQTEWYKAVYE